MNQICTGNPEQIWAYDEPGFLEGIEYDNHHVEKTEFEILEFFYDYWSTKMFERGKLLEVTEENCIDDWIVVNWAYKVNV